MITVWSLDVWGNEHDGYEVNDRSKFGIYDKPYADIDTDEKVLDFLKGIGFLRADVKASQLIIDGDETMLHVDIARNGAPFAQIEIEEGNDNELYS